MNNILVTGASGCVGQYISRWLFDNTDMDILLWVRNPLKLKAVQANHPRIKLLVGDLRDTEKFTKELKNVTKVIHTATAWGDSKRTQQVNVTAVKRLLCALNKDIIEQFIYFSTASILDSKLNILAEATTYGTEYIQTKVKCLEELERHPLVEKIIAVFPTLVFGGSIDSSCEFPTSFLTEGLIEASKWLWLASLLRTDASFHFIHAKDIASICGQIAIGANEPIGIIKDRPIRRLVMGQKAISVNDAVNTLCRWRGHSRLQLIPLWAWLIETLILILPIEINAWDRFSIRKRHFTYDPVYTPENFDISSHARDLKQVLRISGLKMHHRKQTS